MRINNNITALNAHRQYGINNTLIGKSVEKLSSGYRINRAGDDAAGLAISEKMRAQIRGLTMASKNSQDAISLVQTAEGALQETHNILQRMRELAVQSASDTNETTVDRDALNKEFQQLISEINDIASKTKFNDQPLIDGTFASNLKSAVSNAPGTMGWASSSTADGTYTITASAVLKTSAVTAAAATETANNIASSISGVTATFTYGGGVESDTVNGTWTLGFSDGKFTMTNGTTGEVRKVDGPASLAPGASDTLDFGDIGELEITNGSSASINSDNWGVSGSLTLSGGVAAKAATYKHVASLNGEAIELQNNMSTLYFANSGVSVKLAATIAKSDIDPSSATAVNINAGASATIQITVSSSKSDPSTIQTGANQYDELRISIEKMDSQFLGISEANISNRADASTAVTQVNSAVNQVSTQRASLGALQNRLNHKIANLDTSAENLQAAESRIRDVDMAKEMTNFTRNNILFQASTAMLAQANALPQGVLQLLG